MSSKKDEIEKRVIELREQGKTYREIMKELNVSPGLISSILKKSNGEEETKPVSIDTQARKLFSQGKTPLEVANELDLSVEETERIYRDFWKLKGLYDLYTAYEDVIKRNIRSFLTFYRIVKEREIGEKNLLIILEQSDNILALDDVVQDRVKTMESYVDKNRSLIAKNKELQNEIEQSKNTLQQCQSKIASLSDSIRIRSAHLQTMEKDIGDLNGGGDYSKSREIAEQRAASILNSKQDLLMASVVAVLIALREDPKKSELITGFDFYESDIDNSEDFLSDVFLKKYIQTHYEPILDTAEMLYDKILKIVQNHISRSLPKA
jgi:DNA-binding CsgD family transcriptional regulator